MKPFNLEEFKSGAIAMDGAGNRYRFVTLVPDASPYSQLVIKTEANGFVSTRHINGRCDGNQCFALTSMESRKRTAWANVFPSQLSILFNQNLYSDILVAMDNAIPGQVLLKLEWEE